MPKPDETDLGGGASINPEKPRAGVTATRDTCGEALRCSGTAAVPSSSSATVASEDSSKG